MTDHVNILNVFIIIVILNKSYENSCKPSQKIRNPGDQDVKVPDVNTMNVLINIQYWIYEEL